MVSVTARSADETPKLNTVLVLSKGDCVKAAKRPLVVDLDGTLSKTDTHLELMVNFVSQRLTNAFPLVGLLTKDRATMKGELFRRAPINAGLLPLNTDVNALIDHARAERRPIALITSSDQHLANAVADAFGPFDHVLASKPGNHLKASTKADALVELFGHKGFDYVGNDLADVKVFSRAYEGFLASPKAGLMKKATATGTPMTAVGGAQSQWPALFRAIRPHHWVKNALIVIPASAAWLAFSDVFVPLVVAFMAFSFMASSVYLVNDMWDVQHDRLHPKKKTRPLASGELTMITAGAVAPLLSLVALVGSWLYLGWMFSIVLVVYAAATLAYSTWLKRVPLVDVFILAGLYGLRIVAGAVAVSVPLSLWLTAFGTFAFLSLAFIKRFTDLNNNPGVSSIQGRGYLASDAPLVQLFGVVSGFMAAVILALYVDDPILQTMYSVPQFLWAAVPVWLYWISRAWLLAHRGEMNEDPLLFAVTDRVTYFVGVLIVVTLFLAR
jgi:4-hydroxybenzoate polyprenyltransferase/phosphoserine phosphatase